jgi:hypothetical protein
MMNSKQEKENSGWYDWGGRNGTILNKGSNIHLGINFWGSNFGMNNDGYFNQFVEIIITQYMWMGIKGLLQVTILKWERIAE